MRLLATLTAALALVGATVIIHPKHATANEVEVAILQCSETATTTIDRSSGLPHMASATIVSLQVVTDLVATFNIDKITMPAEPCDADATPATCLECIRELINDKFCSGVKDLPGVATSVHTVVYELETATADIFDQVSIAFERFVYECDG